MICGGLSCCARWRELYRAYEEGRREEAVQEMQRAMRMEPAMAACPLGGFIRFHLVSDGWAFHSKEAP